MIDLELDDPTGKIMQEELDQVLLGINSMANAKRFNEVQKTWPMSTNIDDRRDEDIGKILEDMRKKKF